MCSGTVLARGFLFSYGTTATATAPQMPAGVRSGDLRTTTAGGTRYRVAVSGDPESGGLVIAAVPLREVDQTLHRLLIVEALVHRRRARPARARVVAGRPPRPAAAGPDGADRGHDRGR